MLLALRVACGARQSPAIPFHHDLVAVRAWDISRARFMKTRIWAFAAATVILVSAEAQAGTMTFGGSMGSLSAQAIFNLTGSMLTVTLTNTSAADVLVPADVLTGVFFDTTHGLTPVSAALNGSTVFYGSIQNNVGEGWVYGHPVSAQGMNSGISAAGLGIFGDTNFFYSPPVTPLDGIDYGILSAGDNSATGNGGVTGGGPLIKNAITFTLSAAAGFDLSELGDSVVFQYGTATTEPTFNGTFQTVTAPVPPTFVLALCGIAPFGIGAMRRKMKTPTV